MPWQVEVESGPDVDAMVLTLLGRRRLAHGVQTADSCRVHALQRHSHTDHYHPVERCRFVMASVEMLLICKVTSELSGARTPGASWSFDCPGDETLVLLRDDVVGGVVLDLSVSAARAAERSAWPA